MSWIGEELFKMADMLTDRKYKDSKKTRSAFLLPYLLSSFLVDGFWSGWTGFSACNVTCGSGARISTRSCDNPRPAHGGRNCEGPSVSYEECGDPAICPSKFRLYITETQMYIPQQAYNVRKTLLHGRIQWAKSPKKQSFFGDFAHWV